MNRHLLSIALLLILLSPFLIGFTGIHWHKRTLRKAIKRQIINGIDQSKLTLLSFSKVDAEAQLEWEHEHEFEFNGTMYDIVKSTVEGDSLHYWCWEDNEETTLNRQLILLLLGELSQNEDHQQGKKLLLKNFLTEYHFEKSTFTFGPKSSIYQSKGLFKNEFTPNTHLEIICPPPQI